MPSLIDLIFIHKNVIYIILNGYKKKNTNPETKEKVPLNTP